MLKGAAELVELAEAPNYMATRYRWKSCAAYYAHGYECRSRLTRRSPNCAHFLYCRLSFYQESCPGRLVIPARR